MTFSKSVKWNISMGINSGYDLDDQKQLPIDEVVARYQKVADQVEEECGVYYSAVVTSARTVYKGEWGCPAGGEYSYFLSGSCNPAFSDVEKFKEGLLMLVKALRREFQQSTLLLEVMPAEVYYDREEA